MEKVTIEMKMSKDAFRDIEEAGLILRKLARRLCEGQCPTKVMDGDGNSVGTVTYE